MDIPDVRRVVQFQSPRSLTEWVQHFGRAGRDGRPAVGILLVEPSVYQTQKKKKKETPNRPNGETNEELPYKWSLSAKRKGGASFDHSDSGGDNDDDEDGQINDTGDVEQDEDDNADPPQRPNNADHNQGTVEHKKKLESGMRSCIETHDCRRKVFDEYFRNPPRTHGEPQLNHVKLLTPGLSRFDCAMLRLLSHATCRRNNCIH